MKFHRHLSGLWKRSGRFRVPEESDRARALTRLWDQNWPGLEPVGYMARAAYPDRRVRFHSLPNAKRLADNDAETAEILLRYRTVLAELMDGSGGKELIVIGTDFGPRDLAAGWVHRLMPGAWPWRKGYWEEGSIVYYWVAPRQAHLDRLDQLLRAVAHDECELIIVDETCTWIYHPYDGGADVILPSTQDRDNLSRLHPEWLAPPRPD